ncbi:hypothetical protein SAMN05444161_2469 [Rhizobiales bacterium GAS191]|jgi:hypothetical protein|nr:hypothetical protein SAMN05519103_01583 [Rhizobiales bacterium GAS113]SEC14833.1 hypothetical protein SAMN05519104_0845 [Rhizobiales bacterium GAS188]SED08158.1 hypothetical protein SAMN05444161_2469 [Rhizobiales bacterium GAS191]
MPKPATKSVGRRVGKATQATFAGAALKGGPATTVSKRVATTGESRVSKERFEAVMKAAERSGLLSEKSSRIGGRVSPALVEQAKRQTGIEGDTDLLAFALANVALEDNFGEAFKTSRGKVAADLKLGF